MKGMLLISMFVFSMQAHASFEEKLTKIEGFETLSGEIISNLNLQESSKVLKSLETSSNIEIRDRVFYPEEVSQLIGSKLTKGPITAKRPNQGDYL